MPTWQMADLWCKKWMRKKIHIICQKSNLHFLSCLTDHSHHGISLWVKFFVIEWNLFINSAQTWVICLLAVFIAEDFRRQKMFVLCPMSHLHFLLSRIGHCLFGINAFVWGHWQRHQYANFPICCKSSHCSCSVDNILCFHLIGFVIQFSSWGYWLHPSIQRTAYVFLCARILLCSPLLWPNYSRIFSLLI